MENMFAQRIKQVREENKMTQKAFSEFLEIKQQTLSGYETGKITPSLEVAFIIAQKLDVSLDWLCGKSNKRNTIDSFEYCSDVISALYRIDEKAPIYICKALPKDIFGARTEKMCIYIESKELQKFLNAWEKMLDLYHNKTIDQQLYELWLESQLRAYENTRLSDLPFDF